MFSLNPAVGAQNVSSSTHTTQCGSHTYVAQKTLVPQATVLHICVAAALSSHNICNSALQSDMNTCASPTPTIDCNEKANFTLFTSAAG